MNKMNLKLNPNFPGNLPSFYVKTKAPTTHYLRETPAIETFVNMEPKLKKDQQTKLCTLIGKVQLRLLYQASIHGFTAAAFHRRCDRQGPTLTVGYNSSGYIFGGYASKEFDQTNQYVQDDKAFLFSLYGTNPIQKYPVAKATQALRMVSDCGPWFGDSLYFFRNNQQTATCQAGFSYSVSAVQMNGEDQQLTECEVFKVEESLSEGAIAMLEKPWRSIIWKAEKRREMIEYIKFYKPMISSVSQVRVLLVGPVGAGKSSFFNSINSIFRGHVTSQAIAGSSATSLTTQFRTYSVKAGRGGQPLPIILCDTMGLEESTGAGVEVDDISSILRGHMLDRHQFNASAPLQEDAHGYRKSAQLKDRIHCVAYVVDSCKVSIMSDKLEAKLAAVRKKVNLLGIPQLALMTKTDEACPCVADNLRNIYSSQYIKTKAQEVSVRLGLPMSCVVPIKNYSEELDLDLSCDIVLLIALVQMLRFADNYFDEVTDQEV